jgi:hypothetical protein
MGQEGVSLAVIRGRPPVALKNAPPSGHCDQGGEA